jgi:putative transposase
MARQRKLTPEKKALLENIRQSYNPKDADDVQDMLKDLPGDMLQEMLESEMDDPLGYSKYDYKNKETDDSRNGYSKKAVTSSMGQSIWIFPGIVRAISTLRRSKRTIVIFPT